jgi:fused signal recognition particle receptor
MLGWFKKKKIEKQEEASPAKDAIEKKDITEKIATPQGTGIFGDTPVPDETDAAVEHLSETPKEVKIDVADKAPNSDTPNLFKRLTEKLSSTRNSLVYQMDAIFLGKKEIDEELLDDLEELLITADLGVSTVAELLDYARKKVKRKELSDPHSLKILIKEKIRSFIVDSARPAELVMPENDPFVIMVIGVNGVGKTTTIGKIAHKFVTSGQSVLLAAGDTFRAAAVAQLKIWGERNNVEVVAQKEGTDPSAVAFDAMSKAITDDYDVVLVDTAGRLHTQSNLMEELKKIKKVMGKKLQGAPHEVMLVIDATTGQNGISQAKLFDEAVGVTGLTLTKLDGTAKGGIVANISRDLNIPIRFIGIGEQIEDLRDFDPDEFIDALFKDNDINQ